MLRLLKPAKLVIIIWIALLPFRLTAQEPFAQVRLEGLTPVEYSALRALGLAVEDGWRDRDGALHLPVSVSELQSLQSAGWSPVVEIPNLTAYFQTRSVPTVEREFPLGSMLGNYTLEEALARMDTLAVRYPNLVSPRDSIGATIENRAIWAFKISDNPTVDEAEPEVLFTGVTHAREPLGMMNILYFAQQLCENYGTDPEMTFLINHREIWFIPMINVDGYVYNQTQHPEGGGMHRKNRRNTGCGNGTSRGVDLNRNFDYDWGGPGASSYPCDNTFRGDSAFSEPESRVVRDFILNHDFSNVLHYHAYGNVLIFPFGDGSYPPEPDETTYREIGAAMTVVNHFPVGTGNELLNYGVSGDQTDWTYGVAGMISYIPEVGTNQDNFWPSEDRVLPLCEEQVVANEIFARVAGPDLRIKPLDALHDAVVTDSVIQIQVANQGLQPGTDILLNWYPLNALVETGATSLTLPSLAARSIDTLAISIQLSENAWTGLETGLIFTLSGTDAFTITDTVRWIIGTPTIVFTEDFESGLGNWNITSGSWGLTGDAYTGQFALSDSPTGPYPPHAMNVIQLAAPVNLQGLAHPTLQLAAHWDIEPSWDFVQVQAFAPGMTTVSLAGAYTSPGTGQGSQPLGEPGYHGRQNEWVLDALDLGIMANQPQVYIRFILTSDAYVQRDGFVVDDLQIQGYPAYRIGDANLDMNRDVTDVLTISDWLEISPLLTALQRMLADVNQDSILNDQDVNILLEQIMEATP
ncbi:MAG: hypothetical protein GXO90_00125 [FCB group bacterium]|nr:hypothetical protein [FCB group bacterium]